MQGVSGSSPLGSIQEALSLTGFFCMCRNSGRWSDAPCCTQIWPLGARFGASLLTPKTAEALAIWTLMDTRHALIVDCKLTQAIGTGERDAAKAKSSPKE